MLRFFFIEYGAQDEIETSYEEGCNRIQKTFDTILRLVDFPFDPGGGGGGGGGKKTVSRCKNTFFLPRSRRLSPRRDGIYMHDSRKLNGSTSDRGHLFNCTKQTVHARWKIHAPLPPSRIVYESSPGVEGKLDYRRSNTESDQIARKGLHPSSLSVQRRRLPVTHAPSLQFFPLIAKFRILPTDHRHEDIQIPSQITLNRGDCPSIVADN